MRHGCSSDPITVRLPLLHAHTDIEITAELVRDLLRDQHPDLTDHPLTLCARGGENQPWRLGDDRAVRLPWATQTADALLRFCLTARRSLVNVCAFFSQSGCTGLPRLGPCSRLTHTVPSIGSAHIAHTAGSRRRGAGVVSRAAFAAQVPVDPSVRVTDAGDTVMTRSRATRRRI